MSQRAWPLSIAVDAETGALTRPVEGLLARAGELAVLLLVVGPEARRQAWAPRAAAALASAWAGRGRPVTLVDLDLESPCLHEVLDLPNAEGIADVIQFGTSIARVAVPAPGGFGFVAAGPYAAEPETILAHPRWRSLILESAEAESTLLLYVPAGSPGLDAIAAEAGFALALLAPEDEETLDLVPEACPALAALVPEANPRPPITPPAPRAASRPPVVRPPVPEPTAAGARHELEGPAARRELEPLEDLPPRPLFRLRTRIPARPRKALERPRAPVLWMAAIAVVALGAWAGGRQFRQAQLARAAAELASPRTELEDGAGGAAAGAGAPVAAEPARPVQAIIPYSVAVEAYQALDVAQRRADWLAKLEPDIGFFVSPVAVQGVVYYRVMAGPAEDSAGAAVVMDRLVKAGHKTGREAWSLRRTGMAFQVDEFDTRAEAERRRLALSRRGVPTYIVEVEYTRGPSRFRLYAGAYEGRSDAAVMEQLLQKSEIRTLLVPRIGRPHS